jgi:hypothetical protein
MATAEKYDLSTNSWTSIASMHSEHYMYMPAGAVAVGGYIYTMEGSDEQGTTYNTVNC